LKVVTENEPATFIYVLQRLQPSLVHTPLQYYW